MKGFIIATLILFGQIDIINAYEVKTHAELTELSVNNSFMFSASSPLTDLNINYLEQKFNGVTMLNRAIGGSEFEDQGILPLNHFFDPANNGRGAVAGLSSPDWMLGNCEGSQFNEPGGVDTGPSQLFSFKCALDYYYKALTQKDPDKRETEFGELFRSMGHLAHHMQDMAQPQHTRNDMHCDKTCIYLVFPAIFGAYNPSLYEKLTKAKKFVTTINTDEINNEVVSNYNIPIFNAAREFWVNSSLSGIANFSNLNFISDGTNFIGDNLNKINPHVEFPLPIPLSQNEFHTVSIYDELREIIKDNSNPISGEMDFVPTRVHDNYTFEADEVNEKGSTFSIFNQDFVDDGLCVTYKIDLKDGNTPVREYENCNVFSYNRLNVEAARAFLIKRAIAYSTGLINYFFRGRLDITDIKQVIDISGQAIAEVTVKNLSTQNFDLKSGKLEIYYDRVNDGVKERKKATFVAGGNGKLTSLANGAETTLKIVMPTDVDPDIKNPFIVVYTGIIGEELGVAGKVFRVPGEIAILRFYMSDNYQDIILKRSTDFGRTWQRINNPLFTGSKLHIGSGQPRLVPSGIGKGILAVLRNKTKTILRTTDNGQTWQIWLEQGVGENAKQTTEVNKSMNAIHVGSGRLVSISNHYYTTHIVNPRKKFDFYSVQLDLSTDDGESWQPMNVPMDLLGNARAFYYLGNDRFYLFTNEYDGSCECMRGRLYLSTDFGENFNLTPYQPGDLDISWNYIDAYYEDAFDFDSGRIIATTAKGPLSQPTFYFIVSDDGGQTFTTTESAVKHGEWPWTQPLFIRPLGPDRYLAYVFDTVTAINKDLPTYYEGILLSADKGQTWQEVYQGQATTWVDYIETMGVLTKDVQAINYIH